MVIIGGESNHAGDLNDLWAFDFESKVWHEPELIGKKDFIPKRFHTANTFDKGTKVVTFGGC